MRSRQEELSVVVNNLACDSFYRHWQETVSTLSFKSTCTANSSRKLLTQRERERSRGVVVRLLTTESIR